MSARNFPNWLHAYLDYASVTEAPRRMHAWAGVSAIAGALRRQVWIDMKRYTLYPSFYIVFVAKPGIVAKSTTLDISTDLLKQLPAIKFGPNSVTWQALVEAFADASEEFFYNGMQHPMSALTLAASELGTLLDLQNRDMINLLIEMWDGKKSYEKLTKGSGQELINAPWINLIAGTTPDWMSTNMTQSMIGGGLASRCIFIYAEAKDKYIAFIDEHLDDTDQALRRTLIADLELISHLKGEFIITPEAREWERQRYEVFWKDAVLRADNKTMEGYAARKQTHLLKIGMVLSASRGDSLCIELQDLMLADGMLIDVEKDLAKVFASIGRSEDSLQAEHLIEIIRKKGAVPYEEAYKMIHIHFPDFRDFEGILDGAVRSGQIKLVNTAKGIALATADYKLAVVGITPDTTM